MDKTGWFFTADGYYPVREGMYEVKEGIEVKMALWGDKGGTTGFWKTETRVSASTGIQSNRSMLIYPSCWQGQFDPNKILCPNKRSRVQLDLDLSPEPSRTRRALTV